jgi:hypothetical protein
VDHCAVKDIRRAMRQCAGAFINRTPGIYQDKPAKAHGFDGSGCCADVFGYGRFDQNK